MREIQKQIYLYQCLRNGCFVLCVLCFGITIWLFYRLKRKGKSKAALAFFLLFITGCFVQTEEVQALSDERIPVMIKMKDGTELKYSKVYDKDDFRVFHNPETEDVLENIEDIQLQGVEKQEEVFIKEIEGVMEEKVKDVAEGKKVSIILTKAELGGKDAGKYRVDLEAKPIRLKGNITIKKRKINLTTEEGIREYGHYNEIEYSTDTPVQENKKSYTNSETEGLLEGDYVRYPTPCEKEIEKDRMPDYPPGKWNERITVNHDGDSGTNYYFNYDEVSCGNLVIEKEEIKESSQYIDFETDREQIYISEKSHKVWVDGQIKNFRVLLKKNHQSGFYTDVCTEEGKIISQNGEGLDFSKKNFKEGEEQKLSLYLYHRKNRVKSQTFEISIFMDSCAPEVANNTVGDKMHGYDALPDTMKFSKFYGVDMLKVEEFRAEDKNGSGVRKWFYHIMRKEGEFAGEEIRKYIDTELKKGKWELLSEKAEGEDNAGPEGRIELPKEEKNYIILIKIQDNLGHTEIYVSDGIMIDGKIPEVKINLGENQKLSETGIYGDDITLDICVEDEQSAAGRVEICVASAGKETAKENLLEYDSLEEREKYKKVTLPYTVRAENNNSNDVCVTVTATDYAGNRNETAIYFKIDTDLPQVQVQCYSQSQPENSYYYKNPVTVQFLYEERNFSREKEYLWFQIDTGNGSTEDYAVSDLEEKLQIETKWIETEDVHVLEMVFEEGKYTVIPFVRDMSQRQNKKDVVQGQEKSFFIDTRAPLSSIDIVNASESRNCIFNEDVQIKVQGQDIEEKAACSGLKKVYYTVSQGNVEKQKRILFDRTDKDEDITEDFLREFSISAKEYEGKNIEIKAFVEDMAGNTGISESVKVNMDVTYPEISVQWDIKQTEKKGYYNTQRTAIVEIKDSNFDASGVKFDIKGETKKGKWQSDGQVNRCQITFQEDGEYKLALSCEDRAGNIKRYEEKEKFVIDRTKPVVEVFYDDNGDVCKEKYFNRERVATIVIREKNFDKNQVEISTEGAGKKPILTEFTTEKGVHKAKIYCKESGEYIWGISCRDKAGNQSEDFRSERFCVDLDLPEIEILNLKDKSANKDTVAPFIQIKDLNYQRGGFTVDITGSNNKSLNVKKTVKPTKQGENIQIADLPRKEDVDDFYRLSVVAVDKAGNWAKKVIQFSVNRYGSVYIPDLNTQSWLCTDGKNHTYMKEEKDIGILEYNVDPIKERTLTINRDGELKDLKEGIDYTIENLGNEGKWKKSHYKIKAENFQQEGNYTIILNSRDMADNVMNNTSIKREMKTLPLSFTIDKTPPTIILSGIEKNERYQTLKKEIVIDIKDNLALEEAVVKIGDRKITYGKEELKRQNGIIKEIISSKNKWQNIEIFARDAADNREKKEKISVFIMPDSFGKPDSEKDFNVVFVMAAAAGVFIAIKNTKKFIKILK